jgi:hypothetical protein
MIKSAGMASVTAPREVASISVLMVLLVASLLLCIVVVKS